MAKRILTIIIFIIFKFNTAQSVMIHEQGLNTPLPKVFNCVNSVDENGLRDLDNLFQRIQVSKSDNFVSLKFLNKKNKPDCVEAFLFDNGDILINNINDGVKTKGNGLLINSSEDYSILDLNKIYKGFYENNNLVKFLERKENIKKLNLKGRETYIEHLGEVFNSSYFNPRGDFFSYLQNSPSWPYWFDTYYSAREMTTRSSLSKFKKDFEKKYDVNDTLSLYFKNLFMSYLFASINYEERTDTQLSYDLSKTFVVSSAVHNYNFWANVIETIKLYDNDEVQIFGNYILDNNDIIFDGKAIIFSLDTNNICDNLYEKYPEVVIASNRFAVKNCRVEFSNNNIKSISNENYYPAVSNEKLFEELSIVSKRCEPIDQKLIDRLTKEQSIVVEKNQKDCKEKEELVKLFNHIESKFNDNINLNCITSFNERDKFPNRFKEYTLKSEKPFQNFSIQNNDNIQSFKFDMMKGKLVGAQNIDINNNDKYLIIDFDKMHFWLINKNHIDDMSKSPAGTPRQLSFLFGGVFVPVHEAYKCDDY